MNRRAVLKTVALAGAASALPRTIFARLVNDGGLRERIIAYLERLGRADGGYGWEDQEQSHLTPTFYVIACYRLLQRTPPRKELLSEFVRTHHPAALKKLEQERRIFEWQQVQALVWLEEDASPLKERILGWKQPVTSLANDDGGFADRPGWFSNPMATYYALDALDALDALGALESVTDLKRRAAAPKRSPPSDLKLFTIQVEAHGHGSPADAVELARALRIHLWGAKNARPEWLARAQAVADQQRVPVKFFVSNEEYGTWVNVPGLGTYSHTSDIIAPADAPIGAALVNQAAGSWADFRSKRLAPLEHGRGRLIWQFGENEELVRMFLDDSVERGGYAAISTYHFGNPDFTNSEPFLHRWRGQIPFIALQDSHGPEPWWFADMTTGFRTVFLATEPTWDGWLNALKQNWVVAIRHDQWSGGKTWMHSGSREMLEFVRAHERDWRWWDNPDIRRPLVSVVAVRPNDEFETARPDKGVTLRIRCAWENTPQGLLEQPIAELVKLCVDGAEAEPTLVSKKRPSGALLDDHYHYLHLPALASGMHMATVSARVLATKEQVQQTLEFPA